MYLGADIFVARLRRPQLVEGSWEDVDRTVDLFDLMDEHRRGEASLPPLSSDGR
jgi:hypothetical protein